MIDKLEDNNEFRMEKLVPFVCKFWWKWMQCVWKQGSSSAREDFKISFNFGEFCGP